MNWWREFADHMTHDAPLGRNTWFRLGGRARHTFAPRGADQLARLLDRAARVDQPVKVLGAGANVLVRDDGFAGVVVRLDAAPFQDARPTSHGFEVGAGVDLMGLSKRISRAGWSGLECMAGIPGTLGGAIRGNAGGRFGAIADVVRSVRTLTRAGVEEELTNEQMGFGYRRTRLGDRIVLSATLDMHREDPKETTRRFDEYFAYKRRTQPLGDNSAGCIFKNPPGQSAGTLIDGAGLKGTCCGAARVSEQHANFIVAERGATATDVLRLIDLVRGRVAVEYNTRLELEIDVW